MKKLFPEPQAPNTPIDRGVSVERAAMSWEKASTSRSMW
jgi:hypothetical protein